MTILGDLCKIPWCVVVGCNNYTFKKNRDKDASFFRIPKDGSLKRIWVQNIKKENLPKDPKICHLHFDGWVQDWFKTLKEKTF